MVLYDEDVRAQARRDIGVTRELEQTRTRLPDPSRGGTRGYPVWFRLLELERRNAGDDRAKASRASIYRWDRRIDPFRMAGGVDRSCIVGTDQLLMSTCLTLYPEAQGDEITMFIYDNGGRIYQRLCLGK